MIVAISSTGKGLEDALDTRFGRTRCFVIVDLESKAVEAVDNTQNLQAMQGAGIQAAMHVVEAGAECVITGHCGPKAFRVLNEAGIKVYLTDAGTVKDALARYEAGQLKEAETADVEGHWA